MKENYFSPIEIGSGSIRHLAEIRKWAMLFSVFGFIIVGLSVLVLPAVIIPSSALNQSFLTALPVMGIGVIYFFPVYYLLRFSITSGKAISLSDPKFLDDSFRFLKYHYRSMGVILGLMMIVYAIAGIFFFIQKTGA